MGVLLVGWLCVRYRATPVESPNVRLMHAIDRRAQVAMDAWRLDERTVKAIMAQHGGVFPHSVMAMDFLAHVNYHRSTYTSPEEIDARKRDVVSFLQM